MKKIVFACLGLLLLATPAWADYADQMQEKYGQALMQVEEELEAADAALERGDTEAYCFRLKRGDAAAVDAQIYGRNLRGALSDPGERSTVNDGIEALNSIRVDIAEGRKAHCQ